MNKETLIAIIMVGLIILAGVQAIEISGMKSDLAADLGQQNIDGNAQGATRYSSSASSAPSSAGMVGGC